MIEPDQSLPKSRTQLSRRDNGPRIGRADGRILGVDQGVHSIAGGLRRGGAGYLASLPVRLVAGNVVVGVGYWLLAQLGSLAQYTGAIEVAWLPVGFAAGMLYLGDLRWFVGGMVGDFMVGSSFSVASLSTLKTWSRRPGIRSSSRWRRI